MSDLPPLNEEERRRLFAISDLFIDRVPQNDAERTFQIVWTLEGVVNNAGFSQYFSGFAGSNAPNATDALRALGALGLADLVDRALQVVGPVDWNDDDAREDAIAGLSADQREALEQLDDAFTVYPDGDTERLHWALIQAHPNAFQVLP